jgi:hypothetical protein
LTSPSDVPATFADGRLDVRDNVQQADLLLKRLRDAHGQPRYDLPTELLPVMMRQVKDAIYAALMGHEPPV